MNVLTLPTLYRSKRRTRTFQNETKNIGYVHKFYIRAHKRAFANSRLMNSVFESSEQIPQAVCWLGAVCFWFVWRFTQGSHLSVSSDWYLPSNRVPTVVNLIFFLSSFEKKKEMERKDWVTTSVIKVKFSYIIRSFLNNLQSLNL